MAEKNNEFERKLKSINDRDSEKERRLQAYKLQEQEEEEEEEARKKRKRELKRQQELMAEEEEEQKEQQKRQQEEEDERREREKRERKSEKQEEQNDDDEDEDNEEDDREDNKSNDKNDSSRESNSEDASKQSSKDVSSKENESNLNSSNTPKTEVNGTSEGLTSGTAPKPGGVTSGTTSMSGGSGVVAEGGSVAAESGTVAAEGATAATAGGSAATGGAAATAGGSAAAGGAAAAAGPVILVILVIVIVIIIIIGLIGFFVAMPGSVVGKIGSVMNDIWTRAQIFVNGNNAAEILVSKEDVVDAAQYLDQMGYDLAGYGFLSDEIEDTVSAEKDNSKLSTFISALKANDTDESGSLPYKNIEETTASKRGTGEYVDLYLSREYNSGDSESDTLSNVLLAKTQDGELEYARSKHLAMYLTAENATYLVRNYNTNLSNRGLKILGLNDTNVGSGLIHFWKPADKDASDYINNVGILKLADAENWIFDRVYISRPSRMMVVQNADDGILKLSRYSYSLDGWVSKYGLPLQLSLALHLSTLAPDFAYTVAANASKNTTVDMALLETTDNNVSEHILLDLDGDGQEEEYYLESENQSHMHKKASGGDEEGYATIDEAMEATNEYLTENELGTGYDVKNNYNSDPTKEIDELEEYLKQETNNGADKITVGYIYYLQDKNSIISAGLESLIYGGCEALWQTAASGQYLIHTDLDPYLINIYDSEGLKKIVQILISYNLAEVETDSNGNQRIKVYDRDDTYVLKIKAIFEKYFCIEEIGKNEDLIISQKTNEKYPTVKDIDEAENNSDPKKGWVKKDNGCYYIEKTSGGVDVCDTTYNPNFAYMTSFGDMTNVYIYYQVTTEQFFKWFFEGYKLDVRTTFIEDAVNTIAKHFPVRTYYRLMNLDGTPVTFNASDGYVLYDGGDTYYIDSNEGWFWRRSIPKELADAIKDAADLDDNSKSGEILDHMRYANTEDFIKYIPFITEVKNHWYQDLDFTGCYEWDDSENYSKYEYNSDSNDDESVQKAAENKILLIEERGSGDLKQIAEPKILNPGEWIMNLIDNEKYYIYDGVNKSSTRKKIEFGDTCVDVIAMLEQIDGEDAQTIIKWFRELMANYGVQFKESVNTSLKKELFSEVIEGYNQEPLTDGDDSVYRCQMNDVQAGFSEGVNVLAPVNGKIVYKSEDAIAMRIVAPGYSFDGYTILISGFVTKDVTGYDVTKGTVIGVTKKQDLKMTLRDENGAIVKNEYIEAPIEGNGITNEDIQVAGTYNLTEDQLDVLYACVRQEGGGSYESSLAVMSCIMNRARANGTSPYIELTKANQFCYSIDPDNGDRTWRRYLDGNVSDDVKRAVKDGLGGKITHNYRNFRTDSAAARRNHPNGEEIGGNWYFN